MVAAFRAARPLRSVMLQVAGTPMPAGPGPRDLPRGPTSPINPLRRGTMRHSFSSVLPECRDARAGQAVALRDVTRVYRPGGGAVTALNRVTVGFEAGTFTAVMGPSGSGKSTLLQCAAGLDKPTSGEVWLAGQQQRVAIARALVTRPEVVFADEPTGMLDSASGREVLSLLRGLVDGQGQTVIMVTHDPVSASHASRVIFLADGQVAGELYGPTPQSVAARMTDLGARSTGS